MSQSFGQPMPRFDGQSVDATDLSERMAVLSLMASGMAHDLNNVLGLISGNLSLAAEQLCDRPAARRQVANALSGVRMGTALTSDLLRYSRLTACGAPENDEAGRQAFVALEDICRDAAGSKIEIRSKIAGNLWQTRLNVAQLQNAVLNLVTNAREAMDGRGILTVTACNVPADGAGLGDRVRLTISDTGPGIPPDVVEKIFAPFFTTKTHGTGLGLATVREFAAGCGAELSIDSVEGVGTTFLLDFPRIP